MAYDDDAGVRRIVGRSTRNTVCASEAIDHGKTPLTPTHLAKGLIKEFPLHWRSVAVGILLVETAKVPEDPNIFKKIMIPIAFTLQPCGYVLQLLTMGVRMISCHPTI